MVSVKEVGDEFTTRDGVVDKYTKTHARTENLSMSITLECRTSIITASMMVNGNGAQPAAQPQAVAEPQTAAELIGDQLPEADAKE